MRDYKDAVRHFSAESLSQQLLSTSLDQGLSAFIECCQRWSDSDRIALQWLGADGRARKGVSYALLEEESGRFANYLKSKNIGVGDVVAGLLPRIPELLVTALGTWRVGAIYQPLFTAFGPAAIETRVTGEGGSQAKLIVTDPAN